MIWIGVLALVACGRSPDVPTAAGANAPPAASNDVPIAASGEDVLSDSEASLAGPTIDLVRALHSDDPSVRLRAAQALGKSGDRAATPALVRELADKDVYVRKAAAEALGCVLEDAPDDTAARSAAYKGLSALLQDSDMSVRYQVIDAFSRLRERRSVALLIKTFSGDSDPIVRGHAAFALGEIADAAAFDALSHALKDDDNSWKVSYAIAALAKNGDERAARFLLDALKRKQYAMISGAGEFLATQSGPDIDQHLVALLQQTHETTLAILLAHHPNSAVAAAAQAISTGGAAYGRRPGC